MQKTDRDDKAHSEENPPSRLLLYLGAALFLAGLVLAPSFLIRLLSADSYVNQVSLFLMRFLHYGLLALGAFFLLVGGCLYKYRPKSYGLLSKITMNGVLLAGSLAFALVAAEGLLRVLDPLGINFFRHSNKYFSEIITQSESPDLVYEHRPLFEGWVGETRIQINSKKLRDREIPYEKPDGSFRVLCLGDSVTLGWGVPLDQTYPKLLEEKLRKAGPSGEVQVINAGIGGYNTAQEAAFLREEGVKYRPDLVLLLFSVKDAALELRPVAQVVTDEPKAELGEILKWIPVAVLSRFFPSLAGFYHSLTMPEVDYLEAFQDEAGGGWKRCEEAILDMDRVGKTQGAPLVVFMMPARQELGDAYPFTAAHKKVGDFCRKQNIPFFDLLSVFRNLPSESIRISLFDQHPNAHAHAMIAEAIYEDLKQSGML